MPIIGDSPIGVEAQAPIADGVPQGDQVRRR